MKRRDINASDAPQPVGGYSQAVELDRREPHRVRQRPDSRQQRDDKVPADFEAQARQAWANLIAQLHAADMTLDNLVKVTFFLSDRKYIPEYRRVRQEVLGGRTIALTTIITGIFDEQWLLEIEGDRGGLMQHSILRGRSNS